MDETTRLERTSRAGLQATRRDVLRIAGALAVGGAVSAITVRPATATPA